MREDPGTERWRTQQALRGFQEGRQAIDPHALRAAYNPEKNWSRADAAAAAISGGLLVLSATYAAAVIADEIGNQEKPQVHYSVDQFLGDHTTQEIKEKVSPLEAIEKSDSSYIYLGGEDFSEQERKAMESTAYVDYEKQPSSAIALRESAEILDKLEKTFDPEGFEKWNAEYFGQEFDKEDFYSWIKREKPEALNSSSVKEVIEACADYLLKLAEKPESRLQFYENLFFKKALEAVKEKNEKMRHVKFGVWSTDAGDKDHNGDSVARLIGQVFSTNGKKIYVSMIDLSDYLFGKGLNAFDSDHQNTLYIQRVAAKTELGRFKATEKTPLAALGVSCSVISALLLRTFLRRRGKKKFEPKIESVPVQQGEMYEGKWRPAPEVTPNAMVFEAQEIERIRKGWS